MTVITLKSYSDPGHGWVAVKRKMLNEFGVAGKITHFSYQKGNTVYLEEDCDAPTLINAIALKGIVVNYKHRQTDRRSPIRNYESYKI